MYNPHKVAEQYACDVPGQNKVSVDYALKRIQQVTQAVTHSERVGLRQAVGRILAMDDITARHNVPAERNSAMDGYAFKHTDLLEHNHLQLVGTSAAGHPYTGDLPSGACVRIMTGAVLPTEADTVIIQELVERNERDEIHLDTEPVFQSNVRFPGEDLQAGVTMLTAGRKLDAADLGLLASQGIAEVDVLRRPRIAFFATGDELKAIGEVLLPGDVYDSNRYTLFGLLDKLGVELIDMGVIPDEQPAVQAAFCNAAKLADAVITTGGVSVGDADYVTDTLREFGTVDFWRVAVKPGKPLTFGTLNNDCLFFGLPGNPVAVMATFLIFVRPALLKLCGDAVVNPPEYHAVCDSELYKSPGRTEYQRGICFQDDRGHWHVNATGMQGSHILSSMSEANCFIVLPQDSGSVNADTQVKIILFRDLA